MSDQDDHSIAVYTKFRPADLMKIDDWRRHQIRIPNRSAAVRALVQRGLNSLSTDDPVTMDNEELA